MRMSLTLNLPAYCKFVLVSVEDSSVMLVSATVWCRLSLVKYGPIHALIRNSRSDASLIRRLVKSADPPLFILNEGRVPQYYYLLDTHDILQINHHEALCSSFHTILFNLGSFKEFQLCEWHRTF